MPHGCVGGGILGQPETLILLFFSLDLLWDLIGASLDVFDRHEKEKRPVHGRFEIATPSNDTFSLCTGACATWGFSCVINEGVELSGSHPISFSRLPQGFLRRSGQTALHTTDHVELHVRL